MSDLYYPLYSLEEGNWFKLICGASFQDLPAIRSLALTYTLAGADCIDVAADPAVITAAKEGLMVARELSNEAKARGFPGASSPLLMVSLNDGEDPHFRKAEFDSTQCPTECLRPCETICPADAIAFDGVLDRRCYGCGRCLPVCPSQLIVTRAYVSSPNTIIPLISEMGIDAIEIHTQVGHGEDFKRLWEAIAPWSHQLKVLAISCPDGSDLIDYLRSLYEMLSPLPCPLIWQTDGRPMSGDIGMGTTHAAIKLAQKVLNAQLPGYVQLAGGTNHYTVPKLRSMGMVKEGRGQRAEGRRTEEGTLHEARGTRKEESRRNEEGSREEGRGQEFAHSSGSSHTPHPNHTLPLPLTASPRPRVSSSPSQISGVAYGSYGRTLLAPIFEKIETDLNAPTQLEKYPDLLWQAVAQAYSLVSQLKPASISNPPRGLIET